MDCPRCEHKEPGVYRLCPECGFRLTRSPGEASIAGIRDRTRPDAIRLVFYPMIGLLILLIFAHQFTQLQDSRTDQTEATLRRQILLRRKLEDIDFDRLGEGPEAAGGQAGAGASGGALDTAAADDGPPPDVAGRPE